MNKEQSEKYIDDPIIVNVLCLKLSKGNEIKFRVKLFGAKIGIDYFIHSDIVPFSNKEFALINNGDGNYVISFLEDMKNEIFTFYISTDDYKSRMISTRLI